MLFAQTPQANRDGKIGEKVHLIISEGAYKSVMVMPDLVEQHFSYAAQIVEQLGLVVGNIAYEEYESVPPDTVLSHVPKPGALAVRGSEPKRQEEPKVSKSYTPPSSKKRMTGKKKSTKHR